MEVSMQKWSKVYEEYDWTWILYLGDEQENI